MRKLLVSTLLASAVFAQDGIIDKLNKIDTVKTLNIQIKDVQEHKGLYVIDGNVPTQNGMQNITFTVTKDMKYTFFGTAFDNETKEEIIFKKDMGSYIKMSNFTYGKGKDEYLVFTDPQCPYCKKFEKFLKESNLEDKVKVHYILYPLSHHGEALDMSRFILNQSSNDQKLSASYDITVKGSQVYKDIPYTKEELKKLDSVISQNRKMVESLGIMGTPTLVDSNGQTVNIGYFFKKYSN